MKARASTPVFSWRIAATALGFGVGVAFAATGDPSAATANTAEVPAMPPLADFAPIWKEPTFRPPDPTAGGPSATSRTVGGWSLLALIKIGPQAFAILQKEPDGLRMYVGPKPNPDGFSVESAHFDMDPEKEFVTIRYNQQTSVLHYTPTILDQLKKRYQVLENTGTVPSPPAK